MLPWSREPGVADSEADNNSGESEVSIADQAPGVDPRDDTWRGSAAETDARYPDLRALAA